MKTTAKKLILTGIAVLTMASVSACGNTDDSETTAAPKTEITTEAVTPSTEAQKEIKEYGTFEESEKEVSKEDDNALEESAEAKESNGEKPKGALSEGDKSAGPEGEAPKTAD